MKKMLFLPLLVGSLLFGQTKEDAKVFRSISDEILTHGQAYNILKDLTKNIGARLSGSPAYEKAVKWAAQELKKAGATKVWVQPVKVPVWVRGKESLKIKIGAGDWQTVNMLSLGNSEGTKGKDLVAEIIVVNNFKEFDQLTKAQVKGKIVLFNYPFQQHYIETFVGYSDAVRYRVSTASLVAKKGGVAALIRSTSTAFDDVPHTGSMHYEEGIKKIPAVALGPKTAERLARLASKTKIFAKLNSEASMQGETLTHSVIGEITGTQDQQVIVVGAHLDSWDVGEGAHDDGTGVVQAIEVIRTFKKLGLKPKHTIRAVLFANEENGVRGGVTYADSLKAHNEPHIFAIESDSGGFSPNGFSFDMTEEQLAKVMPWQPLFKPYDAAKFVPGYSGTDIHPMKEHGVALAGLMPDSQRYFDLHHSPSDVFEAVNRRELLLGATVITQLIYMVDKYW